MIVLAKRLCFVLAELVTLSGDDDSDITECPENWSNNPAAATGAILKHSTGSKTIPDMFNQSYKPTSETHKKLTRSVALWLVEEGLPPTMVESRTFKNMLGKFDQR